MSIRCASTTASGAACRNFVMEGSDKCIAHLRPARNQPTMTLETVDRIVSLVSAGNYLSIAVAAAGVANSTFYVWWRRGRPDGIEPADAPFREMRDRVDRARAEGEARNVAIIAGAARDSWQAAAWLLERSTPDRWARPSQRDKDEPPADAVPLTPDPFAEVDELALRRKRTD